MDYKNLFEKFNEGRKLLLPDATVAFDAIPWSKHPTFEGVDLKHIITSEKTDGQFSFHLERIAPDKKIGNHIHEKQGKRRLCGIVLSRFLPPQASRPKLHGQAIYPRAGLFA